ncbi:MAG: hypothetical protein ABEH64_07235 [Salinirussus sp.]
MEFDTVTTAAAFVVLVALATGITLATPMETGTVLMMVVPSAIVYGLIALLLGVKHGEYRSTH